MIRKQLNHFQTLEKMPILNTDCVLFLCSISSENLGLIMRSADIFGISHIYYLKDKYSLQDEYISKISRNSTIPIISASGFEELVNLKEDGYTLGALEITDTSIPLRQVAFSNKLCLIVGNEQHGIPENILETADFSCHIEMTGGRISSLNVSIATSIALYEVSQYLLKQVR